MTHSINDNTMYKTARSPVCSAFDRAFTLFEMLITVTIIILATAVVLPAFGRIIESSNFAGAVNTVTATLGNARALAIQNSEYTAVAFLYDIDSEIYTLLPLELQSEQGAYATTVQDARHQRGGSHLSDPRQCRLESYGVRPHQDRKSVV